MSGLYQKTKWYLTIRKKISIDPGTLGVPHLIVDCSSFPRFFLTGLFRPLSHVTNKNK